MAAALGGTHDAVLPENSAHLAAARDAGTFEALLDRLALTPERLRAAG